MFVYDQQIIATDIIIIIIIIIIIMRNMTMLRPSIHNLYATTQVSSLCWLLLATEQCTIGIERLETQIYNYCSLLSRPWRDSGHV